MRVFVVHDAKGRIVQAIMGPTDGPAPILETTPGMTFTEVEPPVAMTEDSDLQDFIKNYQIEEAPSQKSSAIRLEMPDSDG